MNFFRHVVRFAVSAIVLLTISTLVPGFSITGFWTALLASLVIAGLGWVIESVFGKDISPFARGVVGFIVSAAVIYVTAWLVPGIRITFFGALIASLIIGFIDLFVPARARFS
ncbi:phage holin family protein [Thermoflavimicrobium dichotomicum]|uniref:4 TMS phage holin, superfamily IV n=1 Tax=Thermoflavimicrobium dichotomicum TaxID=46223 RepID=A0A1I3L753_9BACL|nr:phage holin family protein [Thermoflavimicrobium dichotomicum]SFI80527.1 4 TMS phage holin, superfamily IV [Thermoflavimicrobium dichotomicum]